MNCEGDWDQELLEKSRLLTTDEEEKWNSVDHGYHGPPKGIEEEDCQDWSRFWWSLNRRTTHRRANRWGSEKWESKDKQAPTPTIHQMKKALNIIKICLLYIRNVSFLQKTEKEIRRIVRNVFTCCAIIKSFGNTERIALWPSYLKW